MSKQIQAAMTKIDASLSMIADKFANGMYEDEASLQAALVNVTNAKSNATKAYSVLAKPATQGRKGITAMATTAFDECMTAVQQVSTKANLLHSAMTAELSEMEENKVTEEIAPIDFGGEETTDEVVDETASSGEIVEVEPIQPVDNNARKECGEEETTEEVIQDETVNDEQTTDDIGNFDLGDEVIESADDTDFGVDPMFEDEEETEEVAPVVSMTQAKKATASKSQVAASQPQSLEACWSFNDAS